MTGVLLLGLLIYAGLAVVLAVSAGWTQGYFYEQTIDGIGWRSAAAAGVLTLLLAVGAFLAWRWPSRFDSVFAFSPNDIKQLDQFWTEKKGDTGTAETHFSRRVLPPGRVDYVDADGRPWRRSDSGVVTALVIEEDGERKRFVARLDADGNFPRDPRDPNRTLPMRYVEEGGRGRVMSESDLGTLTTTRYGAFVVNVLLNLLLLAAWVAVLVYPLGFQARHAAAVGLLGWTVTLLLVWPPLKAQVGQRRPPTVAPARALDLGS